MYITDILKGREINFSFELFPPKTAFNKSGMKIQQHLSRIFDTVDNLSQFDPAFISVTYSPMNETKTTSIPIAAIIKERFDIETVAHITCINTEREDLRKIFDVLKFFHIDNILALRGDRQYDDTEKILNHASDIVEEIKNHREDFSIGVAGYPEGHPECLNVEGKKNLELDMDYFVYKTEKGADFAITQLFLDNDYYFRFVEKARKKGVEIPIIPGIMPVVNRNNLKTIKKLTGATIPPDLEKRINDNIEDDQEIFEIGIEHAVKQVKDLIDKAPCIHFYTMDRWQPTERIIKEVTG